MMSNLVFEKAMENGSKQRNIKLVTTEARKNYLVLELTYHGKKSLFIDHRSKKSQNIHK